MLNNKKVAAIIAEYNPFHNGHAYHIQKTKEITGADYIVILMSTNFVQRGEAAILDRYLRAEAAISHGADAVFELPVTVSTGSADIFSFGATALAHNLGCIDYLSFGAEDSDTYALRKTAEILLFHPLLEEGIKNYMAKGLTFPESRERYLLENGFLKEANLLSSPNNILGISYIHSLLKLNSDISPVAIPRKIANHHSSDFSDATYASAKAIRETLLSNKKSITLPYLPEKTQSQVKGKGSFLENNNFSDVLYFKLNEIILGHSKKNAIAFLTSFQDVSEDLAHRIFNHFTMNFQFSDFAIKLWGKNYTFSRINRALYHILFEVTKEVIENNIKVDFCPYIRPLIIKKDALGILTKISENQKKGEIPLITRIGDIKETKNEITKETFRITQKANRLYQYLSLAHHGISVHDETKDRFMILH